MTTPLLGKVYYQPGLSNGWVVVVDKSPRNVVLVGVFHRIEVSSEMRPTGRWKHEGYRIPRDQFSREYSRAKNAPSHPVVRARMDKRLMEIYQWIE